MKKLIAVLLTLVLVLAACSAPAKSAETAPVTSDNWLRRSLTDTNWIQKDGRATLEILPTLGDEEQFVVTVQWPNSAEESTVWTFYGNYDWEVQVLQFVTEYRYTHKYDENGNLELATMESSAESTADLFMDESGLLVLHGAKDDQLNPISFESLPAAAEKISPLTEAQQTLFNDLTDGLLGTDYEAVGLIEEADDMYFTILCKGTVVYPGAEPVYYIAVIDISSLAEETEISFIQLDDDGSDG